MNFIEKILATRITPAAKKKLQDAIAANTAESTAQAERLKENVAQRRVITNTRDEAYRTANQELSSLVRVHDEIFVAQDMLANSTAQATVELQEAETSELLKTEQQSIWEAYSYDGYPELELVDLTKKIVVSAASASFTTKEFALYEPISGASTSVLFGPFDVVVKTKSSTVGKTLEVWVKPAKNNTKYISTNRHPHVHISGAACLGDFAPTILQHMVSNLHPAAIAEVCRYLTVYNPSSPYRHLRYYVETNPWDVLHCNRCKQPMPLCGCTKQTTIRCVSCFTTENLTSCGSCIYCCAKKHTTNLTLGLGYGGTQCH